MHHLADERVDVTREAIGVQATRFGELFGIRDERGHVRPVGDEKGFLRLRVPLDEGERPLVAFGIDLQERLEISGSPLASELALLALDHLHPTRGKGGVVQLVRIRRKHLLHQPHHSVDGLTGGIL